MRFGFRSADNSIGYGLKFGTKDGFSILKSASSSIWNNVNLRVMYGNYTLLNAWQGNDWSEISPTMKDIQLSVPTACEEDTNMIIRKTSANLGVYIGDFRVFKINEIDSYA